MEEVDREIFGDENLKLSHMKYCTSNRLWALISQPMIVALMTQVRLDKSTRVLEMGTGSGCQAYFVKIG